MKFLKLTLIMLVAAGFFATSCGNGSGESPKTDTAAAPVMDTTMAPPAKPMDSIINNKAAQPENK